MDFSAHDINWFRYVPEYMGNRELPEDEQMSLQIRRIPSSTVLAQMGDYGSPIAWRDKQLRRIRKSQEEYNEEVIKAFKVMGQAELRLVQQFVEFSRDFRNFTWDGVEKADPLWIALHLPPHTCPTTEKTLSVEILDAQNTTITLYGDELKNFVSESAGEKVETSEENTE